jgi:phage shock protein C
MFCPQCGKQLQPASHLCPACGKATTPAGWSSQPTGPMLRPLTNRMIGGVCAALALRYGWSVTRVRLITVLLVLFYGVGAVAYLAAWFVIPNESYPTPYKSI